MLIHIKIFQTYAVLFALLATALGAYLLNIAQNVPSVSYYPRTSLIALKNARFRIALNAKPLSTDVKYVQEGSLYLKIFAKLTYAG